MKRAKRVIVLYRSRITEKKLVREGRLYGLEEENGKPAVVEMICDDGSHHKLDLVQRRLYLIHHSEWYHSSLSGPILHIADSRTKQPLFGFE